MTKAADLVGKFHKTYGEAIGGVGVKLPQVERCPTGFFPFDLASGGGFPRSCVSIVFGPEGSGKTTLALKAIAAHQKRWPAQACAIIDIENSYDPEWGATLGVDNDRLHVYRPPFAEQAVDIVEAFLYADDAGLVVIDSLAALVTTKEVENEAEKENVGSTARIVKKLVGKVGTALTVARGAGRQPTVIYINQIRTAIGVLHGNPEKQPGGHAPQFQSAMTVRVWGKKLTDASISKVLPARQKITASLKKWKVQVVAQASEWEMALIPHKGLGVGDSDDWPVVQSYLKKYGLLAKGEKEGWEMFGETYPKLVDVKAALLASPKLMDHACYEITARVQDLDEAPEVVDG